jgi:hypothetical protein
VATQLRVIVESVMALRLRAINAGRVTSGAGNVVIEVTLLMAAQLLLSSPVLMPKWRG